jgi:hypothetical protein
VMQVIVYGFLNDAGCSWEYIACKGRIDRMKVNFAVILCRVI